MKKIELNDAYFEALLDVDFPIHEEHVDPLAAGFSHDRVPHNTANDICYLLDAGIQHVDVHNTPVTLARLNGSRAMSHGVLERLFTYVDESYCETMAQRPTQTKYRWGSDATGTFWQMKLQNYHKQDQSMHHYLQATNADDGVCNIVVSPHFVAQESRLTRFLYVLGTTSLGPDRMRL